MDQNNFQQLGDIFSEVKKKTTVKPPAHEWQELALQIISDLHIPSFKRNSVFAICKKYPKQFILVAMNDTKELCKKGEEWKYFFKVISDKK
jgi:hypothetical protein